MSELVTADRDHRPRAGAAATVSPDATPPPSPPVADRRGWLDVAEAGSVLGIRFVIALCTLFGRQVARGFLAILALYYLVFYPVARRTAREYRQRLGVAHGFWDLHRHILRFAEVSLDRLFFVRGRFDRHEIGYTGHEIMAGLHAQKRGAILLGAHLGSFEAMRLRSDAVSIPINVVGYFRNAPRINRVLEQLNPKVNTRLISVDPDGPGFIFKVQERIEAGELVAILGDRVGHGGRTEVDFLGGRAELPIGPYALAAVLKCPIYLTFCLYTPPNRYHLYCEPFADKVELPRKDRERALQALAQRYADRLAHYCRMEPDNWFNFCAFWKDPPPPSRPS